MTFAISKKKQGNVTFPLFSGWFLYQQLWCFSRFSNLAVVLYTFNGLKIFKKIVSDSLLYTNLIFIHFFNLFILRHAKWSSQRQKEWCLALYICILDNINICLIYTTLYFSHC